jgi:U32 family peptidase
MNQPSTHVPEILAPAGSKSSFLAALAAGADAVYCGLKHYSARMAASNFTLDELAGLTRLARDRGVRVYVTVNSLLKPDDLQATARLIDGLERWVHPDALIVQDLAVVRLARQVGFSGELHLSTLANVTFGAAFPLIKEKLGIHRVVVPRELDIDEIRTLSDACPEGLGLELFVHGALCYAVSGRCYWSSYMGGKSGLRGRCVQPCRRRYAQGDTRHRSFSCQDLSLDVLVKVVKSVPNVAAWKIEGRKKGAHYVFYTVSAYKMLRDEGGDPKAKRAALQLLAQALGRSGTHYRFLPQRPQHPIQQTRQTGSGLFVGRVKASKSGPYISPRLPLLAGDQLRTGYEDDPWHALVRIARGIPKKGQFRFKAVQGKVPPAGTPVFLTDRTEPDLVRMIRDLDAERNRLSHERTGRSTVAPTLPEPRKRSTRKPQAPVPVVDVFRHPGRRSSRGRYGLWLSDRALQAVSGRAGRQVTWWLPPVFWPGGEAAVKRQIARARKNGAARFVLNAPWQRALFDATGSLDLWAGPFCNLANALALEAAADLGFAGAIVSPELGENDFQALPARSPIPLGMVIAGNYPLCISRILSDAVAPNEPFASPRGEEAWAVRHEENVWVYPNWRLDLESKRKHLERAGYRLFVRIVEPVPDKVRMKKRPGVWNWDLDLK